MQSTEIGSHILKILVSQLLRTVCDHKELFQKLGIEKYLSSPVKAGDVIDRQWLECFIIRLDNLINDPLFFVKAGTNAQPGDFGLLGSLAMFSKNYGEAIRYASNYQALLQTDMHHHFYVKGRNIISRLDVNFLMHSAAIEKIVEVEISAILAVSRCITGKKDIKGNTRVEFSHPPRENPIKYMQIMNTEVHFNTTSNQIISQSKNLDIPIYNTNDEVFNSLKKIAKREIRSINNTYPYSEIIREQIKISIEDNSATLSSVANELETSPSSIKRKLKKEKTSFSDLLDQERYVSAKYLLSNSDQSIEDISKYLGFITQSSFTRAFKKWSSTTPAKYRRYKKNLAA